MEKSVDWQFDSYMQEIFQMKEVDIREYSPLALAYIGDCIFDLVIKSLVMNEGNKQVQKMHKETSSLCTGIRPVQNDAYHSGTFNRRRAWHIQTRKECQKCVSCKESIHHRLQTCYGFEALMGYLYLKKDWKRLLDLVKIGLCSVSDRSALKEEE